MNIKQFWVFVKKESFHILRDSRTLILLFAMPVVLVVLFGYAVTTEIRHARIAVFDPSRDAATEEIIDKIQASDYLDIARFVDHRGQFEEVLKGGEIKLILVFPPDFERKRARGEKVSIQLLSDATDPNSSRTLQNYVTALVRSYEQEQMPKGQQPATLSPEVRMLFNPALKSSYYFVPGVITIIITLVSAMMTSVTIAREKETGTMEILLVSPLKPMTIILGKSVPYLFLSLINTLMVLLVGHYLFEVPVLGNVGLLLAECFLFVLTALSLGLLISSNVKTQRIALMISLMGLFLPTMLLSGFIFPIESMPKPLQWVRHIIPARWFIVIIKDVMLKGAGFGAIWKETAVLGGMTLFFLAMSIKRFSNRLE